MKGLVLLAVLCGAAGCRTDESCTSDAECSGSQQACRLEVNRCAGYDDVATLSEGHCRYRGAACSNDLDCVPRETCQQGTCKADPSLCAGPPSPTCPTGCTWTEPFPCACVCQACPAPP